ncbi:restriction endonuclease [Lampropedia aestuarii]|uniref:Restriction endonuclease n=1 Tax=Lampropedia aestuarii TaxID=2562762 RepID=A0A4S5BP24_9BURK|nr:McrC family protein [Lampropedia aestuarii]THJ34200.1 restriction endonuclease [Lampropedia aestuarii]
MKTNLVTVREYARLTTADCAPSLDTHHVSPSAFAWLCELQSRLSKGGASLLELQGQTWLRLDSLVGVVQTPCGTTLEVLPKTFSDADDVQSSRKLLRKVVAALLDLPGKEASTAALEHFDVPLTEWVMTQFVQHLQQLVRQGLRSDYVRQEEELPFLRGQLNTTAHMRQSIGRAHLFHVRHDVFSPNQAANRLLRLALERVRQATARPDTWRVANELSHRLGEIPQSMSQAQDWRAWGSGRLMARYQSIKPWCELVLGEGMPLALKGKAHGVSLLFPMEKLFENYVTRALRKQMADGFTLHVQPRQHSLALHKSQPMFQLKPDLVVRDAEGCAVAVLDCKWKRVDQALSNKKYDIEQSDMYQMLAYGCRYLLGAGEMYLVYPRWQRFESALPEFVLPRELKLHAAPFDMDSDGGALLLGLSPTFLRATKSPIHN